MSYSPILIAHIFGGPTADDLRRLGMWLTVEEPQSAKRTGPGCKHGLQVSKAEFWNEVRKSERSVVSLPWVPLSGGLLSRGIQDAGMKQQKREKHVRRIGCITQQNGKYLLIGKKDPDGVEIVSSEDLFPHIGHRVQVKEFWARGSSGNNSGDGSTSVSGTDDINKVPQDAIKRDITVTEVKMISDHCDTSSDANAGK
jgi:hypothetical protein